MKTRSLLAALLLLACGPAPTTPSEPDRATGDEQPDDREAAEDPRSLPDGATYADVLRAARALDARRDSESEAGCLLRTSPPRLEADLAVAVRDLPEPEADLDERLDGVRSRVNVLTRWGALGPGDPALPSFAAMTATLPPRREPAYVWVVTDRGVYLRGTAAELPQGGPLPSAAVPDDAVALFVVAEPGVPLGRVAEVLAAVPASLEGHVGLAVALAPDTRLPPPPEPAAPPEVDPYCPSGLPPLESEAPLASPDPSALVARLRPLTEGAAICVGAARGDGAGGAQVRMALRIEPDGRVREACVREDSANDPSLRECLVRAAQRTAFDPASPPGYVDLELPLRLEPLASQRQRPLCP